MCSVYCKRVNAWRRQKKVCTHTLLLSKRRIQRDKMSVFKLESAAVFCKAALWQGNALDTMLTCSQ